jgi:hypothetical protein
MGVRPERDLSKVQFKGMDYIPPCIQHLLDEPVTIGSRNETVALLSSFLQQQGLDEDATILRLIEWNAQRCEPPVEENELTSVVKSIYRGGYRFGCSKARLIAPCDNKNCKMARKE